MSVGTNIRRLRETAEMTQEQLAEKLDVARSTVTQWERGCFLQTWDMLGICCTWRTVPVSGH